MLHVTAPGCLLARFQGDGLVGVAIPVVMVMSSPSMCCRSLWILRVRGIVVGYSVLGV